MNRAAASIGSVAAVLVVALLASSSNAQAPFAVRSWLPDQGLPTSSVLDISQTPDGYLWIATTGGLARFDGVRFEVFGLGQGLSSNRIWSLAVAPDSALFAACEGGSIARWDGARLQLWPSDLGWCTPILGVFRDGSLIGTRVDTLWRFAGARFTRLPDPSRAWTSLVVDRQDRVWLQAPDGAPARLDDDRIVRLRARAADARARWIRDERSGSALWTEREGADLLLLDDQLRPAVRLLGAADETPFLVDRHGRLWSASGTDLILHEVPSGREVGRIHAGLARAPKRIFIDRDDNAWVGTETQGLIRVIASPVRLLRPPVAEPTPFVQVVEAFDGSILAMDESGKVWRVENDSLRRVRQPLPAKHLPPDVAEPEKILALTRNTIFHHWFASRDGALWISTTGGLWRLTATDTVHFTRADGLPAEHLRQIHEDRDGTLWIGTYGAGLVRLRQGKFATLDRRHGLLEDVVSTVLEDDDGNLWLMGNNGIQRISRTQANECLDGKRGSVVAVGYGRESGLRNPETTGYPGYRSRDGRLWFLSIDGVAMVDPKIAKSLVAATPTPAIEALSS